MRRIHIFLLLIALAIVILAAVKLGLFSFSNLRRKNRKIRAK